MIDFKVTDRRHNQGVWLCRSTDRQPRSAKPFIRIGRLSIRFNTRHARSVPLRALDSLRCDHSTVGRCKAGGISPGVGIGPYLCVNQSISANALISGQSDANLQRCRLGRFTKIGYLVPPIQGAKAQPASAQPSSAN